MEEIVFRASGLQKKGNKPYVRVAFGGTSDLVLSGFDWIVRGNSGTVVVFSSTRHVGCDFVRGLLVYWWVLIML